jgi:uncharacterized protein YfaS (alpha-2-macroglobulin family)
MIKAAPALKGLSLLLALLFLGYLWSGASDGAPAGAGAQSEQGIAQKEAIRLKLILWTGKPGPSWKTYDKAVSEQKYERAYEIAEGNLKAARSSQNSEAWVRALIRCVQSQTALHGFEAAVRFLKEEAWPEDLLAQTALHLYYAQALMTYAHEYAWEIRGREKVDSKGTVDLKAWTVEQIFAEARSSYEIVFAHRVQLGEQPVAILSEYIQLNNYPKEIRPTLRDAVTYLYADALADTLGWVPGQSDEVYALDLAALLTEKPSLQIDHPVVKYCEVLGDLEWWHTGRKEIEAAFEARLERLRKLRSNFSEKTDRERIRKNLEARLPEVRRYAWWSLGMATLAEFVKGEDAPDNLVRAHRIATDGQTAYPDSIGGKQCLYIVKSIEAPSFRIEAMAQDNLKKASIGIVYDNLTELYFRAYAGDLSGKVRNADDFNVALNSRDAEQMMSQQQPYAEWTVSLPRAVDFKSHRMFVVPPMDQAGFYVVVASARKDFSKENNQIEAVPINLGDLVLITRTEGTEVHVTALQGSTGKALAGADVTLYRHDYQQHHQVIGSRKTGADGNATFTAGANISYFVLARYNEWTAIDYRGFSVYPQQSQEVTKSLIYTDRSIYRPNQKLFFKVVLYQGQSGQANYRLLPNASLTVSLRDPNGQAVEQKPLVTNDYGTASGEFVIPGGRLLGSWQVVCSHNGSTAVRVEEYKRPTFETKLLDPGAEFRLNKPATIKGEARYYFGVPVTNGKVKWRVTRTPVYPWWWGYYGWGVETKGQIVATGSVPLGEDGCFSFAFTPAADERMLQSSKGITYRYAVDADVTDEGGETRSASRAFRLGFVAVEASVKTDNAFFLEQQPEKLSIVRTNLDGNPAPGRGTYRLLKVALPDKTLLPADQPLPPAPKGAAEPLLRTAGDTQRPRWDAQYRPDAIMREWPDGSEVSSGTLTHNDKGEAELSLPALPAGLYRLRYETKDAFGAAYEMSKEILVAGPALQLPLPFLFLAQKSSVPVGGLARFLALSGFQGQDLMIARFKNAKKTDGRTLQAGSVSPIIEVPITENDRGGFLLSAATLRDHQYVEFSRTVFVPWDNKQLKVEFSTFRDRLQPGQKERWTVKISSPDPTHTPAAAAEILTYMYDRSLDAFGPHHPPSLMSIWPSFLQRPFCRVSLSLAGAIWVPTNGFKSLPTYPNLQPDRLKAFDGYGAGGPGGRGRRMYKAAMPMAAGRPAMHEDALLLKESESETARAKAPPPSDKPEAAPVPEPQAPVQLRSDFSETAFWFPHLIAAEDGSVSFEFTVPDSVTSWNVWAHALTKDLKSGSVQKETRSVKDLMVRPYLPRFLREGDRADLKVVINNASDKEMKGTLTFDIIDPETNKSLRDVFNIRGDAAAPRTFTVAAGSGTNLAFPVTTPARVGIIAFKVVARSGDLSDGELRPIPLLPGRMHLMQSRFVTLKDKAKRTMTFEDLLKNDDPTRINEQLVVTLDAQLFYSVLSALPYLVNYPYECTEQTLNRFLSTGILSSLYNQYPAIQKMAAQFSKRDTQYERWNQPDPNRKMALEETPWLQQASGGELGKDDLINVLDPVITLAQRQESLAKLQKAQTSSGGFPWFPGGPPSPYMTVYLLFGFSKALEFGVDIPKDVVQRAWQYLHRYYVEDVVRQMRERNANWELVSFVNYALSSYPDVSWTSGSFNDAERKAMLDFSFKHWKEHSPYLKGFLALTLKRMGRAKDAVLVWESVMDSAKTAEDQGTFWAPEDRAWLWYNDTIETHAFAIRTTMELTPQEPKLDGLVLWLLLNKKLNHWKSTKATAEVIYSLAKYLKVTRQLGVKEVALVTVGNQKTRFTFDPDQYTGKKNQIVIPGDKIDPKTTSTITVEKETPGFMLASATWHFSTEKMPGESRGDYLAISRSFFRRVQAGKEFILEPLKEGAALQVGDEVEVQISLRSKHQMEYVHLRDPRGAGFEPESAQSRHRWDLGIYWYEEIRDSGTNFFFEYLPQGQYTFKYRIRTTTAGTFKVAPATVEPMYAPEFAAYSAGAQISIAGEGK